MTTLFWFLLFFSSIFMMLLILIQRGRGGGITGALGGPGGQSAFGSKTGDVFTKITVYTAIIWITLSILTISCINRPEMPSAEPIDRAGAMSGDAAQDEAADDEEAAPALPGENPALPGENKAEVPADKGSGDSAGSANDPPLSGGGSEAPTTQGQDDKAAADSGKSGG